eukprot:TRINITY_DN7448_c0_g2_i1.p1 TRINITY_DN7448_c0_g2~~TRINITY_DN7448_c0_g2_i1.p1  ORF type:complete len:508 (+),score=103.76 TRINITY_DN7448_c0_g2_i1:72-1595(+)
MVEVLLYDLQGEQISSVTFDGSSRIFQIYQLVRQLKPKPGLNCRLVFEDSELDLTRKIKTISSVSPVRVTVLWDRGVKKHQWNHSHAFAAIKQDGSLVTWGDAGYGGDSSSVASLLQNGVCQVAAAGNREIREGAFAAVKSDGSVIAWGGGYGAILGGEHPHMKGKKGGKGGGKEGGKEEKAKLLQDGVVKVVGNYDAFAAIKADGSVVTWGDPDCGGDSSSVASLLQDGVVDVTANAIAFAALKADGSVVTWGGRYWDCATEVVGKFVQVVGSFRDFAAVKDDGSVLTWGKGAGKGSGEGRGKGGVSKVLDEGVVEVSASFNAFAALKSNGSVVTLGQSYGGVDFSSVAGLLQDGVVTVLGNLRAFAAIKADGSVVTWGSKEEGGGKGTRQWGGKGYDPPEFGGGDSSSVASLLQDGVVELARTHCAFAAIKTDGSVVTWGDPDCGGDSSAVASQLQDGVVHVAGNAVAFAALKADGSVVTWGGPYHGGDSSSVASLLEDGVVHIA